MSTIDDMLVQARACRANGAWNEAENYSRRALAINPKSDEAHRLLGDAQRGQGRLEQALASYREAIRHNPRTAANHTALGVVLGELGRLDQALEELQLADRLRPGDAESQRHLQTLLAARQNQLGLQLGGQGRLDEANACFANAVELHPENFQALHNLGVTLEKLGRPAEAVPVYERALALNPQYAQAHQNLGVALERLQRYSEAEASYRRALSINPEFVPAHNGLGVALEKQKRFAEAEVAFKHVVELAPGFAEAFSNLAAVQESQNKLDDALVSFRKALDLKPDSFEAHYNFAHLLKRKRKFSESELWYRRALALDPKSGDANLALGALFRSQSQLSEAEQFIRKATELSPQSADAFAMLGGVLAAQDRVDASNEALQQALAINPDCVAAKGVIAFYDVERGNEAQALAAYETLVSRHPEHAEVRMNHAFVLLTLGEFARAWPEYEYRLKTEAFDYLLRPQPRWSGESLAGKTILVQEEQGLGDTLQFVRYAKLLRQKASRVLLECRAPLVSLFARTEGVDTVIRKGDAAPEFDYYVNTMSLPHLFSTTLDDVPTPIPYLHPEPRLVEQWRQEFAGVPEFKVGIAWQGDPAHTSNRHRSFPLALFEGISRLAGVRLYSLQFKLGLEQLTTWQGEPIVDLKDRLGDFHSMAAILKNLDLVITCDSALGHLAGGLGVPVWLPLMFRPDWRWMLNRTDTPWYPQTRLFRQSVRGRWREVFVQMEQELKLLIATARGE